MACGQIVNCLVENVLSSEEKAVGEISHSHLSSTAKLQCDLVQIYILSYFELVLKHFRVNPCSAFSSGYCRQYPLLCS